MTELLKAKERRVVPLSYVAKTHYIPLLFLRNIANDLRSAGLIKALEGKKGGYTFAKDPKTITFGEVLEVLSCKPIFSCCQNTKDGHCHVNLCPHGFSPRRLANEFLKKIYTKSLAEVVENA